MKQAIKDFHEEIDTYYIETQLNGAAMPDMSRPVIDYEFPERADITKLLSQPLTKLDESLAMQLRAEFISNLSAYCFRQETQRHGGRKAIPIQFTAEEGMVSNKRKLKDQGSTEPRKMRRSS